MYILSFHFVVLSWLTGSVALAEEEAPNFQPPSPIPSMNELLHLPKWSSLELGYVAEPFWRPSDGSNPSWNYAHGVEIALQFSSGFRLKNAKKWREIDHWILTLDLQQYSDTGDFAGGMGVVNPPQEINNPAGVYLAEVSLTRDHGEGWFYGKIGSISMDADFLSPDAPGYYTNASFNNQYNVSMEIFPISPMISYGAVVGAYLPNGLNVKTGVYQLSRTRTDFDKRGWDWSTSAEDGLVELAQIAGPIGVSAEELSMCPPDDHTFSRHASDCGDSHVFNELPNGGWQLGGFMSQYHAVNALKTDERQSNNGVYANLTLPVNLPFGVGHRFWMSGVYGAHPERNPVPFWGGTGWLAQGLLEKRPLDLLLLGASWSQLSFDDRSQREVILELDYITVLTDTISLQPSVQWYMDTPSDISMPLAVGIGVHAGL